MGTVFIVDDNNTSAQTLRKTLQSEGYSCECHPDYDTALDRINGDHPCLVLIELSAQGRMNASEFIKGTKRKYPGLPIIIISSDSKAKTVADCLHAPYLLKPIDKNAVVRKVRKVCPTRS